MAADHEIPRAAVGVRVVERVKFMGIPADLTWQVEEVAPTSGTHRNRPDGRVGATKPPGSP